MSPIAYTTDRTWVTGEVVTAAYLNTYVRDNVKWLSTDKMVCRVSNSGTISTTSGNATQLTYDTELIDVGSLHSTSSATGRITIPTGGDGKYLFGCGVEWAANTGGDYRSAGIRLSGATTIGSDLCPPGGTNGFAHHTVITIYPAVATDWFDTYGIQNAGTINVAATSARSPVFWCLWVGI